MRFTFKGLTYLIEFQRRAKTVVVRNADGTEKFVPGKYPDTVARLLEEDPAKPLAQKVYREATVGCWHREPNFSLETGRIRALRMITKTIEKGMKPLMWKAYHDRVVTSKPKVDLIAGMASQTLVKD